MNALSLSSTPGTCEHDASSMKPNYRSCSTEAAQKSVLTPSSSSSSSPSGASTPLDDEVSSVLVTFPRRPGSNSGGLASSGSSSLSLYLLNQKLASPHSSRFASHRPKLSLDMSKPLPIPALSSASVEHSPLGAFSPTASAEMHLRAVANLADVTPYIEPASPKRARASSIRSAFSWASSQALASSDDVASDSYASFWPPAKGKHRDESVPSISRSPSSSVSYPSPPALVPESAKSSRPSHTRSGSSPIVGRLAVTERPVHVRRASVLAPQSALRIGPAIDPVSASGPKGLNPALAAVERASRLRTRCACGVCGKTGHDYPRCPRCGFMWCSRECRLTPADGPGGKHMCRTRAMSMSTNF